MVYLLLMSGGTGAKAGLKRGDLITEFNGKVVLNSRKLQLFVADSHIGEKIKLTVIRNNKTIALVAKIVEFEPQEDQEPIEEETIIQKAGITFSNLSENLVSKFGLDEKSKGVVVVEISPQELNFDLRIGDLIMAINQQYISDIEQFDSVYDKMKNNNKKNAVLLVKRKDFTMFVALPII